MHENLKPVEAKDEEAVLKLASELKEACLKPPPDYEKSDNPILNQWRAVAVIPNVIESGKARFVNYKDISFNLVISVDDDDFERQWTLSIVTLGINRNKAVTDELAELILGDGLEEIDSHSTMTSFFIKKENSAGSSE